MKYLYPLLHGNKYRQDLLCDTSAGESGPDDARMRSTECFAGDDAGGKDSEGQLPLDGINRQGAEGTAVRFRNAVGSAPVTPAENSPRQKEPVAAINQDRVVWIPDQSHLRLPDFRDGGWGRNGGDWRSSRDVLRSEGAIEDDGSERSQGQTALVVRQGSREEGRVIVRRHLSGSFAERKEDAAGEVGVGVHAATS